MRHQRVGRRAFSAKPSTGRRLLSAAIASLARPWRKLFIPDLNLPVAFIDPLEPRIVLSSVLSISEFMAVNGGTLADENGEYSDWIEIRNSGTSAANLLNWSLTDDPDRPAKWRFPSVNLNPGGHLVVFASGKNRIADPNRLHTNFSLGSQGEYLALVRPDGVTVESSYTQVPGQEMDISYGIDPASGTARYFATSTPGQANARAEVVINEIHYDPDIETQLVEFIELHNPGSAAVNLSGASFSQGIEYTFPAGTTLPAGGYLVVTQDPVHFQAKFGKSALGPWVGKLTNEGENVRLVNRTGGILDEVEYKLGFPWPTVGGPPGYSIELINPDFDNNLGGNWRTHAPVVPGQQYTIFDGGATWRYRKNFTDPGTAWRLASATLDSSWLTGDSPIGYDGSVAMRTTLSDMRYNYYSYAMRRTFTVADPSAITSLQLQAMYDDGFNVWINGINVASAKMPSTEVAYNSASTGGARESAAWDTFNLPSPSSYLVAGTNVIAVQVHNVSLNDSTDAFFDGRLIAFTGGSGGNSPSPAAKNSVFAANAAPQMRQAENFPKQPKSGEDVTITVKVTDPQGVGSVSLKYQLVDPGNYIAFADAAYLTSWTTIAMRDDGTGGDLVAGDSIYTAVLAGSIQQHRRLVRYRITATDLAGASITAPYVDDGAQNFAYFVYDGVPAWTGAAQPGVTAPVTYGTDVMNSLPVYHLLSKKADVEQATWYEKYTGDLYKWQGTLVYDGEVYDGVTYRMRGGGWRYAMGKNMWKFDFPRGHEFQAVDDYGDEYDTTWSKLNLGAAIQQGDYWHRGEQGLFESVGFKLFNLAGVPAPKTTFVQFRIVDEAAEAGATQYDGDLWGLYLALEQEDGNFLDEHGLPDGNYYKMEGGTGELNNQGPTQPSNKDDLNAFLSGQVNATEQWWRDNLNLDEYYSYRAIVEAIHHGDIGYGKNYFYYHNPETNKWSVIPWDLDLTWSDNMYGDGREPFRDPVLSIPAFKIEYQNRLREIRDLLFNTDQAYALIDEMAAKIYTAGQPSFVDVDRAMWDYNPVMIDTAKVSGNASKAQQGRFYAGGGGNVIPAPGGFAGMIQKMKNYVIWRGTTATSGWTAMDTLAADPYIPAKPSVLRLTTSAYPLNDLRFRASNFSDSTGAFAAMQWRLAEVTNPSAPGYDPKAPKHYEIDALWESQSTTWASDIAIPPVVMRDGVPATIVQAGHTYRVRVRYQDSTGRWSNWSLQHQFVAGPAVSEPVNSLRITELSYRPADPPGSSEYQDRDDYEFVELKNIGAVALSLKDVKFDLGITFFFPDQTLAPGESAVIVRNSAAFATRYPTAGMRILGQYEGSLSNSGERLRLLDAYGQTILDFTYDNNLPWPDADGNGRTLVMSNTALPASAWANSANWRVSRADHGSPGADESALAEGTIIISEAMTHTDVDPPGDWIELYNAGGQDVDLGGWWLSDTPDLPARYQIPAGTIIPARGYLVLSQFGHFGSLSLPVESRFALDEEGESILLSSATTGGLLTGYADKVSFRAADNGVTFGRIFNSAGQDYFVSVAEPTPGYANAAPVVGPVVINEIMYSPPVGGDEYIELRNISGAAVPLQDWKFTDGVTFAFGGVTLAAGEHVLVVGIDPAAFRTKYSIGGSIRIFGPWEGAVDNAGEMLAIGRRGTTDLNGDFGYVVVDSVRYQGIAPWPTTADGTGASLARRISGEFGGEPGNWTAEAGGTPGLPNLDAILPTAQIVPVSPDPRPGPVDSITIIFNEPVSGFGIEDLSLTRGGGASLLGAGQQLNTTDSITWVLSGLSRIAWVQGYYTLLLAASGSGIADLTGNPLALNASESFVVSRSRIDGTAGDDEFFIRASGAELQVFTSAQPVGEPQYTGPLSAVTDLTIDAGAGDDLIVLASPFALAIIGGAGQDRVEIRGLPANDTFAANAPSLLWNTSAIALDSAEELDISGGEGDDLLTMTGALPYAASFRGEGGSDTLAIEDGVHAFASDLADAVEHLQVHGHEAAVTFSASQHLASLMADGSARILMTPGGSLLLRAGDLALAGDATVDVADNRLIVEDDSGEAGGDLLLGDGIISSTPADPQGARHLAMILNDDGHGGVIRAEFAGESVGPGAVLVMHTWRGDTDLSGQIDGDDYFRLDVGFLAQLGGYQHGDFNLDLKTDGGDYFIIDLSYLMQAEAVVPFAPASMPAAMMSAVPVAPAREQEEPRDRDVWE